MLGRGVIGWGWLLLLFLSSLLVSCGWGKFGVSVGRGVDGIGFVSGIERLGVSLIVSCSEGMYGWRWVPCFALEYVELVWLLHQCLSGLSFWMGSAGCGWWSDFVFWAIRCWLGFWRVSV